MSDNTIIVACITALAALVPAVLGLYFSFRIKKLELLHSEKEKNLQLLRESYLDALSVLQSMVNKGSGDGQDIEALQKSLLSMLLFSEKSTYKLVSNYLFEMGAKTLSQTEHQKFHAQIINSMREDLFTSIKFDSELHLYRLG